MESEIRTPDDMHATNDENIEETGERSAPNATILVVEDDTHLMEGIRDILELNDYRVLTATNGELGLDVLETETAPDLIVSDIMMPRMNGYEFFQAVREDENLLNIPFIFLTAKGERDDIHKGKKMGAEDYVVKPFDAEELLVAVKARLDRHRQVTQFQDRKLEEAVGEVKDKIMNIINHEFRTPLTYVVAYADMVNNDPENLNRDDLKLFLEGITSGANRLRRLVENFIMLVTISTGEARNTYEWRKTPVSNYNDLLKMVMSQYTPLASEKRLSLAYEVEDDLPPIMGDQEYLNCALECLVDNAIKFTDEPGKTINMRIYRENAYVCFEVQDEGKGIPEKEMKYVWDPMYQINREQDEQQGSGSGLAIVAGITSLHGGSNHVISTHGQGSTFTIRIPVYDGSE